MSLYTYNIFTTVAEKGSFIRAAVALDLTPSAVSHAIGNLEQEFGFPLFIRKKQGVILTDNGERMLPLIYELKRTNENIIQEVERIKNHHTGIVRIGAFHSVSILWLPEIIESFSRKYPDIKVEIFRGGYFEILTLMDENRIDIGFISDVVIKDQKFIFLKEDPLVYITPDDYIPAGKTFVTPEEINQNKLIMQQETGNVEVVQYIKDHNLKVHAYLHIDDDNLMMALVERHQGMSILPKLASKSGDFRINVYDLNPTFYRRIGLTIANPKFISPAAKLFCDEVIEYVKTQE